MAAIGPSARGDVVMLDLGANVQCDVRNLVEFAVMGDVFARTVLGLTAPTIGLLNVGSEELKGDDTLRHAAEMLRASHIAPQFVGFVEGHDIAAGTTDMVVTDGFTGNVALKTGEGALQADRRPAAPGVPSSLTAKLAYLLARPGLERLREWLDPRRYNGAVMLGLNGVVVKSHGGTDAEGFAHAVDVAMDMVVHRFNDHIREDLTRSGLDKRRAGGQERFRGQGRSATRDRLTVLPPPDRKPMPIRSILAGVGGYLPERIVSNDELAAHGRNLGRMDPRAHRHPPAPHRRRRTRRPRSWAPRRRVPRWPMPAPNRREVDAIILATTTPDQAFPATALRVQAALGVPGGFGFDLAAACAGFIYALSIADSLIRAGAAHGALVIGSEVYSRILNWQDRGTCVLFGDGAGAVFLRAGEGAGRSTRHPVHAHACPGDAGRHPVCGRRGGAAGQARPSGDEGPGSVPPRRDPPGRGGGRGAGRQRLAPARRGLAGAAPGQPADHRCDGQRLGLRQERVVVTVDRHANTSAASVPLALAEAVKDGRIRRGDLVLMEALGGGLTWGSALVRM